MITKAMLEQAAEQGLLKEEQIAPLLAFFADKNSPAFNTTNVFYYVGAGLTSLALALLFGLTWSRFGAIGLLSAALTGLIVLGVVLLKLRKTRYVIPSSLLAFLITLVVPVIVYSAQVVLGFWPEPLGFRSHHHEFSQLVLIIEIVTVLAALGLLLITHYPLLLLPITVTACSLTLTVAHLILGKMFFDMASIITIWFGLVLIITGLIVDIVTRHTKDYAFWPYLIGLICFWFILMMRLMAGEVSDFFCFVIDLLLIGFGVAVSRKMFVIAGVLGCYFYVTHLVNQFVDDRWLVVGLFAVMGLGIIWLGIVWQKHEVVINQRVQKWLPQVFRELVGNRR